MSKAGGDWYGRFRIVSDTLRVPVIVLVSEKTPLRRSIKKFLAELKSYI